MAAVSISRRLLRTVLTSYVLLTLVLMFFHMVSTYFLVKTEITEDIQQLERTINVSLSQAIWELNDEQIDAIGRGLIEMTFVQAVFIRDENNEIIYRSTTQDMNSIISSNTGSIEHDDWFGYVAELNFSFSNSDTSTKSNLVGHIMILSDDSIVLDAMKFQVLYSLFTALLSIFLISYLIKYLFHKLLTTPLESLSHNIARIDLDNLTKAQLTPPSQHQDELNVLTSSFNLMLSKLTEYKDHLEQTKLQVIEANTLLDKQNAFLEEQVSNKTAKLSETVSKLATQKEALELNKQELLDSLDELRQTQNQLVESSKMASLGGLVAGISHEINTPVGIGVTAVSYLAECLTTLQDQIDKKSLTQSAMDQFLTNANNCTKLLVTNLDRASQLIQSFKDIAVDQTSEAVRDVNLGKYLEEVIVSLQPKFKRTNHQVKISGDKDLVIYCRAGAISQIFTNLILNSLIHAFGETNDGIIEFTFAKDTENVYITYRDNGIGIDSDSLERLFEPFYTTKRGQGGSGLGTHILYNIVTQSLNGKISAESTLGEGLTYFIQFPIPKITS